MERIDTLVLTEDDEGRALGPITFRPIRTVEELFPTTVDLPPTQEIPFKDVTDNLPQDMVYEVVSYLEPARWLEYPELDFAVLLRMSGRRAEDVFLQAVLATNVPLAEEVLDTGLIDFAVTPQLSATALDWAVSIGNVRLLELLLEAGVDPSVDNSNALITASRLGHTGIVELLLSDPRVDPTTLFNEAVHAAVLGGHSDIVTLFLNDPRVDPTLNNYEIIRIPISNPEVMQLLLEDERIDPTVQNSLALRMAVLRDQTEIVRLLLEDGRVDPGAEDNRALITAVSRNNPDIVRLLLQDPRVDPHAQDELAFRIAASRGYNDVFELLMAREEEERDLN